MAKLTKQLSAKTVKNLVTEGQEIDARMKADKKRLEEIKGKLKNYAAAHSRSIIKGAGGAFAEFTTTTVTSIDPERLLAITEPEEKILFFKCVKVNIGDAKNLFGEGRLKAIIRSTEIPANRISFKKEE